MHLFFLAGAFLLLAALLWCTQAAAKPSPKAAVSPEEAPCLARREMDKLCGVLDALRAVMEHPKLGGPGFLTVKWTPQTGTAVVSAQFPNIREDLYRRVIRRELDREELLAEGVPAVLLDLGPDFEAESGGVVLLSVELRGFGGTLAGASSSLRARQEFLSVLTARLGERFPDCNVRCIGGEVLVSPDREGEKK